ncbi:unnamed protein product, partial [Rotaria magnacalcarata]
MLSIASFDTDFNSLQNELSTFSTGTELPLRRSNLIFCTVVICTEKIKRYKNQIDLTKLFKRFRCKTNDNEYQKLDGDSNQANNQQNIGFFQLFRFADRFDFILLIIGLIGVLLAALCFSMNLIIFGKLTAVFADISSSGKCQDQQQKFPFLTTSTNGCPFGINPNAKNYSHLYRFCNDHEFTTVAPSASSVRNSRSQMMQYIYWIL